MFQEVNAKNGVVYMKSGVLRARHAFTTRYGGVSEGVYASLNLGEHRGDEPERVRENYRRLREALGVEKIAFVRQVHGSRVKRVTADDAHELFGEIPCAADGLVTCETGLALIIFTADCIPILFHDPVRGCVGAAHAGWRGTVAGIAGETVRKMAEEFGSDPGDIRAAIGPGIGGCCFETGPEVPEAFRELLGGGAEELIRPGENGKDFVDLRGANRRVLISAGVPPQNIDVSEECTRCLHEKYWSHRYTGGIRGSQASVIVLTGEE